MAMRLIQRVAVVFTLAMLMSPALLAAQPPVQTEAEDAVHRPGGEVNIQLPDLNQGDFLGMTGHQITYIARAASPFFLLMAVMVALLVMFPGLATWLPAQMRGIG